MRLCIAVLFLTAKALINPCIVSRFRIKRTKINALGLFKVRYFLRENLRIIASARLLFCLNSNIQTERRK